jgi:hypothetical protein
MISALEPATVIALSQPLLPTSVTLAQVGKSGLATTNERVHRTDLCFGAGGQAGGWRFLLADVAARHHIGKSLSIAADNTWYSYTETGTEGDVWIAIVRR